MIMFLLLILKHKLCKNIVALGIVVWLKWVNWL